MSVPVAPVSTSTIVVAVDVGKTSFACSMTDSGRHRLLGPVDCVMTGPAVRELIDRITRALPVNAQVKLGIEAAGHYHRPLLCAAVWPAGWELLELNPAHVTSSAG